LERSGGGPIHRTVLRARFATGFKLVEGLSALLKTCLLFGNSLIAAYDYIDIEGIDLDAAGYAAGCLARNQR